MKKKKGGGWKGAAVAAVILTVIESVPALDGMVSDFLMPIAVIALIGWLAMKLFRGGSRGSGRARRESAPTRMGRKAGSAFYNGAMDWLSDKPQSQYEQEIKARNEARKKYAWHEQQAKKYAGTSDGAWHEQRMKELYNKLR